MKLQIVANAMAHSERAPRPQKPAKPQKTKEKSKTAEENTLSLSKPDYYLRGLNYDDRKKKHGDERSDKRRAPRRTSPLLILIILIIVAGGVYGLWYWLNSQQVEPTPAATIIEEYTAPEIDTLIMRDSLMMTLPVDSLQQVTITEIERINITTNNIVTE